MTVRPTCTCTSVVAIRGGALACATCGAPVVVDAPAPPATVDVYGSRPPYPAPPGRSHRWVRDHARAMGGVRVGGARGRDVVWTVTAAQVAAYDAARTAPAPADNVVHVDADAWVRGAGYRTTRGAS